MSADHEVREDAVRAGMRLGTTFTEAMISSLVTGNPLERWNAAHFLRCLGYRSAVAAPYLIEALRDAAPDVRGEVVRALGVFDAPPPDVVAAICHALADKDPRVRIAAIRSLSSRPYASAEARTALAEAHDDPYTAVREAADHALSQIVFDPPDPLLVALVGRHPLEPAAIAAASWHRACLKDEVLTTRLRIEAASAPACARADAVPILVAALHDPDADVRQWAARLVPRLGAEAQGIVGDLSALLNDPDRSVRSAAYSSLAALGPLALDALPALRAKALDLQSPDSGEALESLAKLGTPGARVLVVALADPRSVLRRRAAYLIGGTSPPVCEAVPALTVALRDVDPGVREAVVYALGSIGDAAEEAAPSVERLLDDADPATLQLVSGWLRHLGRSGQDAVIRVFRSADAKVRRQIVRALAGRGPDSTADIAMLSSALRDEDHNVRREAAWELQLMGPPGAVALAAATKSPDAKTHVEAQQALERLGTLAQIVTGTAPPETRRSFDRTYRFAVGDKRVPVESGTIWLYFTEWYGPHNFVLAEIQNGRARISLTAGDLLQAIAPMGNIDHGSFSLLVQTDGGTWYRSRDIALDSLWENLPDHIESLGRCERGRDGEWELVLPQPQTRRVELRDLGGRPESGHRVPILMFLGISGHCGATDGRAIGTFTTDEKGRLEVQAARVALALNVEFYETRPDGLVCRNEGIVTDASQNVAVSRLWSLTGMEKRLTLRVLTADGAPVVAASIREAVCLSTCGANDGPVGATDAEGNASLTVVPAEIEVIVVIAADGRRRNLTDDELADLFEKGHLTLTW